VTSEKFPFHIRDLAPLVITLTILFDNAETETQTQADQEVRSYEGRGPWEARENGCQDQA
jgi:hypothetical protein